MTGRTTWFPKDAAWHRRGRVVELGQQHGPAGPLVADWLMCEARSQNPPRTGDGTVKAGYAALAHGCFLPGGAPEARAIVATAVAAGQLDDFSELDDRTFTARVSGWNADVNLPLDAARKAAERAKRSPDGAGPNEGPEQGDGPGDEPGGGGTNGAGVPDRPVESPTCTEQNRSTPSSLRSDGSTRSTRASNDDRWPDRLPQRLYLVAEVVLTRLAELSDAKGGRTPVRRRVGELVADFPEHDHRTIVGEFCDYWRYGAGERTQRSDWCRTYRDRCKHVVARPVVPIADGRRERERLATQRERRQSAESAERDRADREAQS